MSLPPLAADLLLQNIKRERLQGGGILFDL